MAYPKTNWVDNTTSIDEDKLNKIEQGIYDNSLVVDAITNTLNPTDTETYKTAELTEGQITDVIGISDIAIKGDTSQNGTPTPSAPVDINVVSGSNVINISDKNLFDGELELGTLVNGTGELGSSTRAIRTVNYIKVSPNTTYTLSNDKNYTPYVFEYNSSKTYISNSTTQVTPYTFTTSSTTQYIKFRTLEGKTENDLTTKFMLQTGSTATNYEAHQSKEFPLDLPIENLFDSTLNTNTFGGVSLNYNNDGSITLNGIATSDATGYVFSKYPSGTSMCKLKANTSYIASITKIAGNASFGGSSEHSSIQFWQPWDYSFQMFFNNISNNKLIISKTPTTEIDLTRLQLSIKNGDVFNNFTIRVQFEQSSKANAYTPYGTDPIELCKIGDYQDYFYKSGSKWYLHKEIGKVILDGSESWNFADNTQYSNSILRFSTSVENKKEAASLSTAIPDLLFCDKFKISYINYEARTIEAIAGHPTTSQNIALFIDKARLNTEDVSGLKIWLASNNVTVYYVLATATDTEITDTTLISQLEAIYNAPLYEQTNITQTNNDLPMVLDITACKDNINGIKAFIRK